MSDLEARRAIREDLADTLVVEAAAGTGKTTEMIARIIAIIRTGATRLEQIVAVTFTEKAAGEMKLRLRTELERARQLATGEERARLEVALGELEVARIGSIHSFCADLLRERPIEARIDPLFDVAAEGEAERIYNEAFDRWLHTTLDAPTEGVRRMLRRNDPREMLRRAGWNLVDRRDFTGAWRRDAFDRDAAIDQLLRDMAGLAALHDRADYASDFLAEFLKKLDRWLAELGRRENVRPRDHDGLEAELHEIKRWWEWKRNGRGQMYGSGIPRGDVLAQRDALRAQLEAFIIAADADLAARLHGELRPLIERYERSKARTGQLDFLDLLARARDLLRDDPRVRIEMQQRFTHFFVDEFQDTDPLQVEILMLLCADNPAISDPDLVTVKPGKLFVVGDPKQAIYRFRRADIALYERVKQRLVADGARLLYLTTSYRSVPSIQTAINAAFAPVMTGGGQAMYVPLEPSRPDPVGQPTVVALPVPAPYGMSNVTQTAIEESYPDAVAAFIDWLVTKSGWTVSERGGPDRVPVQPRHICLMFRRFQSFGRDLTRPYVRGLEARAIPHVLMGGRSFHEREEILAARNALDAIEWPGDEMAVYATLRGPFFAFHDEDLIAFKHVHHRLHPLAWADPIKIAQYEASLAAPEAAAAAKPNLKLSASGLPVEQPASESSLLAIAKALGVMGELHRQRNRRPIADTFARLLAATRAHAGLAVWPAGEQALANLFRIMDMARRFESGGATSFRAFVERIEADAERGKQPDAPVVEDGTEGVRIMTVHAAKGLEFPVVVLCDPTAPLASDRPSHYIDASRDVWLESLAGCVPIELREHEVEVLKHDREEVERLAYVAVTRARDLLVAPVVGDEEREGWLEALNPVVFPHGHKKRKPAPAEGCPAFTEDSVVARSPKTDKMPTDSVSPGLHVPRAGAHSVVWWDPHVLALGAQPGGGLRHTEILQADETGVIAGAGQEAHTRWQTRKREALDRGATPSIVVRTVTAAAEQSVALAKAPEDVAPIAVAEGSLAAGALAALFGAPAKSPASASGASGSASAAPRASRAGMMAVALENVPGKKANRPHGKRFGTLVHAILASVDLRGDADHVKRIGWNHARLVNATPEERDAAIVAVIAALRHPLLVRAAAASDRGELRREVPVVAPAADLDGFVEGIVDLAFIEAGEWTVIDFKTDAEMDSRRPVYEAQVREYAHAIAAATNQPARAVLLIV
ncbi:MAG: UvrD-helicase domain-containing protein [Kofleriaceae bacterium]